MSFFYPLTNTISQYFGANPHSPIQPNGHYGVDFAAPVGTPVRAVGDGIIRFADWNQKMGANPWQMIPYSDRSGIVVMLDHGAITTMYAHLDSTTMNVGQTVKAGEIIGKVGNTGYSFGAHLHLEMILEANVNGYMYGRVNPLSNMSRVLPASAVVSIILKANQRRVGPSNAMQRDRPVSTSRLVRTVPANTIEEFEGYVIGEPVNSGGVESNIWYKDKQGYVWAGGFTAQSTSGLPNLTAAPPLKPNQRKLKNIEGIQRATPFTSGTIVRKVQKNTVEEFTGFVYGEMVDGNSVWFKDAIGYIWSGGFLDSSTTGLEDQTSLLPNQRLTASKVLLRDAPNTDGKILRNVPQYSVENFTHYAEGQSVEGNDIWYKDSQGYVWSGGFTTKTAAGLRKMELPKPTETVKPKPEVVAPANDESYTFKVDFPFAEYQPAHTTNMQHGNFPAKPTHVVLHQFNARDVNPSIDGVLAHFKEVRPGKESSAHFAVSEDRIVQAVSLKDRAFHAGSIGNSYIGIEVDPDQDSKTVASMKKLLTAIQEKYGYLPIYIEHKDVAGNNTSCGVDIDLELYRLDTPVEPAKPSVPSKEDIDTVLDYLKNIT